MLQPRKMEAEELFENPDVRNFLHHGVSFEYFGGEENEPGSIDGPDFFYQIAVRIDDRDSQVVITRHGVSVFFLDGSLRTTSLSPLELYPGCTQLDPSQLAELLDLIEATLAGGEELTPQQVQTLRDRWKDTLS